MSITIVAQENTHLKELVAQALTAGGPTCDLNYIDVSRVTNFMDVFCGSPFNGKIDQWTPAQAVNMGCMFEESQFNGDISKWKMPYLRNTTGMFKRSAFNGDISEWTMPKLSSAIEMFAHSKFNGDLSKWNVGGVRDFRSMFKRSAFAGDLSSWKCNNTAMTDGMFHHSFEGSLPFLKDFPENACRTGEYERMFSGVDKLQMYLARRSFDHSHAAYVMDSPVRPLWLKREDFGWTKSFVRTGRQLGLNPDEIIDAMVNPYRQYKLDLEPVSLVGMDLH